MSTKRTTPKQTPLAAGLAGGVISAATLEKLVDKKVLTLDEARTILDSAMKTLAPLAQSEAGGQALRMIGSMLAGKFSKDRDQHS
jgi:hypothetical protein